MTRAEAEARAARLNDEATDGGGWIAHEPSDDDWEVVRVHAPGLSRMKPTGSHSESRPRPDEPPDSRPSLIRNIPPFGPG